MKHLTLLTLLVFSPLSLGEDVWYSAEEQAVKILQDKKSPGAYKQQKYRTEKFTVKYEKDENRLAIKGRAWGGDDLYYMECDYCSPSPPALMRANTSNVIFTLKEDRFFYGGASYSSSEMSTGTCAKF